jgi:hypothetical protein
MSLSSERKGAAAVHATPAQAIFECATTALKPLRIIV